MARENVLSSKYIHSTDYKDCLFAQKYCSSGAVRQVCGKVGMDAREPAALLESSTGTMIYFSSVQPHSWLHLSR